MRNNDVVFSVLPGKGGDVGKILLNRPQYLNALNFSMCVEIKKQLEKWAADPKIKVVIIAGAGEKAFCAGGDVVSIYKICQQEKNYSKALDFFRTEYVMNEAIFCFPKPYVAFLDGITMGGGVGVSIHGSHSVATERLIWAMPETGIGFFTDVGVGYHLARLPQAVGIYLGLLGEKINARDAYQLNIVKGIVSSERLNELESALVTAEYTGKDFDAVSEIITNFHNEPDLTSSLNTSLIAKVFSASSVEEIIATLQKNSEAWAVSCLEKLLAKSPLSLKVTFEHLLRCAQTEFGEIMQENLVLARNFIKGHDFMEGVRAAVIDKDKNPHWQPPTLSAISSEMVSSFFLAKEER